MPRLVKVNPIGDGWLSATGQSYIGVVLTWFDHLTMSMQESLLEFIAASTGGTRARTWPRRCTPASSVSRSRRACVAAALRAELMRQVGLFTFDNAANMDTTTATYSRLNPNWDVFKSKGGMAMRGRCFAHLNQLVADVRLLRLLCC